MLSYLESLTVRLALATAQLPTEVRARHAHFLTESQRDDGGFAGREGDSDLYYTGFGLRSMAILGLLDGEIADRAANFLRTRMSGQESIVDFFSLIYGANLIAAATGQDIFAAAAPNWADAVAEELEKLRCDDGGYAKGAEGKASSTYHTFLVLLCRELITRPAAEPERIVKFILSQAADGGGFREIRVSKRAGTNPTAAAIGTLRMLGALEAETSEDTIDFLSDMQVETGGIRANSRIPIADTLSTFTGVLTLIDLAAKDAIDCQAALDYFAGMERTAGGFHGAEWDEACDVEYTFYGLAGLALLQSELG
ncbi:MAG: terpene cyclase/mutase family protein [Pirellulaceae bacterium]|nr:terpene cyclase/mutase family protein [Pirellulaceae bacterium]